VVIEEVSFFFDFDGIGSPPPVLGSPPPFFSFLAKFCFVFSSLFQAGSA